MRIVYQQLLWTWQRQAAASVSSRRWSDAGRRQRRRTWTDFHRCRCTSCVSAACRRLCWRRRWTEWRPPKRRLRYRRKCRSCGDETSRPPRLRRPRLLPRARPNLTHLRLITWQTNCSEASWIGICLVSVNSITRFINPIMGTAHRIAWSWYTGRWWVGTGLLHLVQRGEDWAGPEYQPPYCCIMVRCSAVLMCPLKG